MPVTITDTYLEVHVGTTASGNLVGSQVHKSEQVATIDLDDTELGVDLNPGTRYCAIAKCKNSENVESAWCQPVPFQTLILAELTRVDVNCGGSLTATGTLTYDTLDNVVQVAHCGIRFSKNSNGSNYTEADDGDGRDFTTQGMQAGSNLDEHTTYYIVPFATDQLGQTYVGDWAYATTVTTLYNAPTITISSTTHTYNSVGGTVVLNSSDSLKSNYCYIEVGTSGGTNYKKLLSTSKGTAQSFSFADGDTDANGNTVVINSNTQYNIRVTAFNNETNGCHSSETTSVTTDQVQNTITISSIDTITPTSAVAHLSYATGDGGQTQGGQQNQ